MLLNMLYLNRGVVSERLKEHAWKACYGESHTRVRISSTPPSLLPILCGMFFSYLT